MKPRTRLETTINFLWSIRATSSHSLLGKQANSVVSLNLSCIFCKKKLCIHTFLKRETWDEIRNHYPLLKALNHQAFFDHRYNTNNSNVKSGFICPLFRRVLPQPDFPFPSRKPTTRPSLVSWTQTRESCLVCVVLWYASCFDFETPKSCKIGVLILV